MGEVVLEEGRGGNKRVWRRQRSGGKGVGLDMGATAREREELRGDGVGAVASRGLQR